MIQTIGVYHIGIPADDLGRAERFYTWFRGIIYVLPVLILFPS